MSATIVRDRRQTTLPKDVLDKAGIGPKDQVEWSFEAGKIIGRKLVPQEEDDGIVKLVKGPNGLYRLPKGKKFKQKQIKKLLLEIRHEPLLRQREILDKCIEDWKGGKEEQLDDILFMGISL